MMAIMIKTEIKCPRCREKTFWEENPSRPFCSEKCRLVDLGRWASEEYSIAGANAPQPDEENENF